LPLWSALVATAGDAPVVAARLTGAAAGGRGLTATRGGWREVVFAADVRAAGARFFFLAGAALFAGAVFFAMNVSLTPRRIAAAIRRT
jgi:hypothetical protein